MQDQKKTMPRQDEQVEKFINYIMKNGKKTVARKIFDDMMKEVRAAGHMNPIVVLRAAIDNASPIIMIKSARVG